MPWVTKRPHSKRMEVDWKEGVRQVCCSRAGSESGETGKRDRKRDEGSLLESQPSVAAVGPWENSSAGQQSHKGLKIG